jgi:hypothetical protein
VTSDERQTYRTALQLARDGFDKATVRLHELANETDQLEITITNLRKTITALSAMCSDEPGLDKLGITDSVLQVMGDAAFSFSTAEVVNALEAMGFDLRSQKNAQASVHAVLSRLAKRGKLTRVANARKNSEGHPWEWRGPAYNAEEDLKAGYCYAPGQTALTDDDIPF